MSVWQLLQLDVVICNSNFLKARYTEAMRMELFGLIANTYDTALAREMCPGIRERRIKVPLHSELYQEWNRRIPVIIFDEAHDYKNEETLRDERSFGVSRGSTHEVASCLSPDSGGLWLLLACQMI